MHDFDLFEHVFIDNQVEQTLFLLHGTGGDERDLLPLTDGLGDRFNLVGLRGNVNERGMWRFFARSEPGVFDEESIRVEADKLQRFVSVWRREQGLGVEQTVFLGYSNGANMILALALLHPDALARAVVLHPMLPMDTGGDLDLSGMSFLVTYGERDRMIDPAEGRQVVKVLEEARAAVEVVSHAGGHEIRREEVEAVEVFLT